MRKAIGICLKEFLKAICDMTKMIHGKRASTIVRPKPVFPALAYIYFNSDRGGFKSLH
jgi:hypothetical protein